MAAMTEEARLAKNARISEKGRETRDRHATMLPRIYSLKINIQRLSMAQKEALERMFLEAKWFRNNALNEKNYTEDFRKSLNNVVSVKTHNGTMEQRKLLHLGAQVQQGILQEIKDNIKSIAIKKENGHTVGSIRFAKEVKSINLKQKGPGNSYEVYQDSNRIRVIRIPGKMRVHGMEQLNVEGLEYANAKLQRKPDGYYLAVTTYQPKLPKERGTEKIGLDMGIRDALTENNGISHNHLVEESGTLKQLQRKLSRQVKGSNGYVKTMEAIRREY